MRLSGSRVFITTACNYTMPCAFSLPNCLWRMVIGAAQERTCVHCVFVSSHVDVYVLTHSCTPFFFVYMWCCLKQLYVDLIKLEELFLSHVMLSLCGLGWGPYSDFCFVLFKTYFIFQFSNLFLNKTYWSIKQILF